MTTTDRSSAALLVYASLLVAPLCASPGRVLADGARPADARLVAAVTLGGEHLWSPYEDLEDWNARRERVRRQILVAAGLWPMPEPTPLRPVIHGAIDRGDYTIQKVFFQSYPGMYVTGNLYRPVGRDGRLPAILSPHGHWPNGRFYERSEEDARKQIADGKEETLAGARFPVQARHAQLARMGCIVFHYDMVGYADSKQIGHASGFLDVEAELRMQTAFGLQTYNTVRALDFLASLPDVDPERIGVTGSSGGGTQTFILCAIDSRPAAAFPAVMVSTAMQGGCVCENASHLRVGSGNVEFAALAAPRPYGMTGANDWTKEILTKGLPELKTLYRAYGKEELVEAWCFPSHEHNYNQVARELMYNWFQRHLNLDVEAPVKEQPFEPVPPPELSVFDTEHQLPADAVDAAKLRRYLSETSDEQLAALTPPVADGLAEFRRVVGGALEVLVHSSLPAAGDIEERYLGDETVEGRSVSRFLLGRTGAGEAVPAVLLVPEGWRRRLVLAVHPGGKEKACFRGDGLSRPARILLAEGVALLSIDVFLTGEYVAGESAAGGVGLGSPLFPKDDARHEKYVGYTFGYNRTLIAQRVHDILTAIAFGRGLAGTSSLALVGIDEASTWTALAGALAGPAVDKLLLGTAKPFDFSSIDRLDHPDFLPGAVKYGGLSSFLALRAPLALRTTRAFEVGPVVEAAYAAAGHRERLGHLQDRSAADGPPPYLQWLLD